MIERYRSAVAGRLVQAISRAPMPAIALPRPVLESVFAARRTAAGLRRREIEVGGFTVPYLEGGEGDPTLLLHGFSDSKDSFVEVARLLRHRRLILPDLPGFGETTQRRDFSYSLPSYIEFLTEFLDALGVRNVDLVGNSLGGAIATLYSLSHPDRVGRLVLVNAAGVVTPAKSPLQERLDAGENPFVLTSLEEHKLWVRFVLQSPPPIPAPILRHLGELHIARGEMNEKILRDLLKDDIDLTPRLRELRAPVLVLWGDCDRVIDLSGARVYHEHAPDARLVILHEVGHCPQIEAPHRTAALLDEFLRS